MEPEVTAPAAPPSSEVWDWGMTVVWGLVVFGVQMGVGLVFGVLYVVVRMATEPDTGIEKIQAGLMTDGTAISLLTIASALVTVPLILLFIRLRRGWPARRYLAFNPVGAGAMGLWTVALVGWIVLADAGAWLMGRPVVTSFVREAIATAWSLPLLCFAVAVAAPVGEELFFRGFLFEGLRRSRLRERGTIAVSSLFWAALHVQYGAYEILTIFVLGLVLGWARWKTESIWPPLVLHVLCNVVGLAEAYWHPLG